jgi:hypothetical protein
LVSQTSSVTVQNFEKYQDLIKNATDDLEAHLQNIDDKLDAVIEQTVNRANSDTTELRRVKEERKSTLRCLKICAQLSEHIKNIPLVPEEASSSIESTIPEKLTINGLQECKNSLDLTTAKLERHMHDLMDRLVSKSSSVTASQEDREDLARLREEWDTTRQCRDICAKADVHLKQNISVIDNYGTGDVVQFMVSTNDQILHGTNRGHGWRTRQVGGHLSDASVQQLSRDMAGTVITPLRGTAPSVSKDEVEQKPDAEFERYGRGFTLTSKNTSEIPVPKDGKPTTAGSG